MPRFLTITSGISAAIALVGVWYGLPLLYALMAMPVVAAVIPLIVLRFLRGRRHKLFGIQLPEALELITRSLKAGHPVPVAISMVAREMPDPIGTEFGVVADEVTYGSDLVRERGKLRRKVRAISTEGRMSAYILTAVPALLMVGIMVLMPSFYESVWDEPMTWYLIGASVTWLMIGNAMMFKMSNFRF
jgi:tight adherence protein B